MLNLWCVSPIWKIKCLKLEDNHMNLGFVDKDIKCISMAKSYNKWLGSIEIFMNHVYVFNLITLHYPDVNEVVLVRDLHAQNPSKAVVVHHFQLFLLCLRHVPSFTPIQEMRHNKCVKHLHDAMHSRNNWTLAHRLAVIAQTCSHSSI